MLPALISAFLAGAISVLGFAPFHFFPLPVLSLAFLFHLWREASPARAAAIGFAFGAGLFGIGVSWVYVSLHDFGAMAAPLAVIATAIFCAVLAGFPALAGWVAARAVPAATARLLLVGPATWVLAEWIRGWFLTGFPWLGFGYAQIPGSPIAGYAPLLGAHGVSLAAALCAGLIAYGVSHGRHIPLAAVALGVVAAGGWALKQASWTHAVGAPLAVSLVQGNVPQDMKWRPERAAATLITYRDLSAAAKGALVILPETALPLFLEDVPLAYLAGIKRTAEARGADVLVGVPERPARDAYFNSVVSVGASPRQTYRKQHLVPFGEFIPFKPLLGRIVEIVAIPLTDFARGRENQPPLRLGRARVAVNICYEDAFGEEIVRALADANILVNVSNDAWFGDSFATWQHLQMSQMRALETGREVVRATNTGITARIRADGTAADRLVPFTRRTLETAIELREGTTPYVRFGNTPLLALAATMLALGTVRGRIPRLF